MPDMASRCKRVYGGIDVENSFEAFDRYRRDSLFKEIREHGVDDLVVACNLYPSVFETAIAFVPSDDVVSPCDKCGRRIHYRPYVPEAAQKWCLDCIEKAAGEDSDMMQQLRKDAWDAFKMMKDFFGNQSAS